MTELKTLRDIEKPIPMNTKYVIMGESKNGLTLSNDLRVAAREWIETLKTKKEDVHLLHSQVAYGTEKGTLIFDEKELSGAIKILKHFFNLEE